jgi:hypothetical protein
MARIEKKQNISFLLSFTTANLIFHFQYISFTINQPTSRQMGCVV